MANLQDAIDYDNIPYSKITLKTDLNYTNSLIPSEGIYDSSYRLGDTLTLSFEEKSNYNFLNWVIEPAEAMEYVNCRRGNHKVTLKVLTSDDVTIYPLCVEKNTLALIFTADHAKVSPSDQVNYYIGDTFPISCYEEDDYCFIKWQVFDSEGNQLDDYSDYIDIDQPYNPLANVTVFKTGELVTIKPLIVKRPKVVTATPVYNSKGVFRNTTLLIMFDEELDRSSIYYSDDEIEKLTLEGNTLLTDSVRGDRCYGYVNSDGERFYKNIEIKHYGSDDENYLKYFGAPYLDQSKKNVIKIAVNKENLPPSEIDFLVTLKNGFCYKNGDTLISLKNDYSYIYRTSSSLDNISPSFGRYDDSEDDFVVRIVPETENQNNLMYKKEWLKAHETIDGVTESDFPDYNLRNGKFYIRGIVTDAGIGVSSVTWSVSSIETYTNYYPEYAPYFYSQKILTRSEDGVENVTIDTVVDLTKLNLKAGFYKFSVSAIDRCDNEIYFKDLYFLYDIEPVQGFEILGLQTVYFGQQIKWTKQNIPDMKKMVIVCEDNERVPQDDYETIYDNTDDNTENDSLYNFEDGKSYTIYLKAYDYAGNVSVKSLSGTFYDENHESGLIGFIPTEMQGSKVISDKTDSNGNIIIDGQTIPNTSEVIVVPLGVYNAKYSDSSIILPTEDYIFYGVVCGQYDVTWDFYNAVMGTSGGGSGSIPATGIDYADIASFCNKLSEKMGLAPYYTINGQDVSCADSYSSGFYGYRIPNWLEWPLLAKGADLNSSDWNTSYSGSDNVDDVAWYTENSSGTIQEVGQKLPNRLKLYDMSGNVYEMTYSYFDKPCYGGCYESSQQNVEIGNQFVYWSEQNKSQIGFRIVRNYQ